MMVDELKKKKAKLQPQATGNKSIEKQAAPRDAAVGEAEQGIPPATPDSPHTPGTTTTRFPRRLPSYHAQSSVGPAHCYGCVHESRRIQVLN